MELALASASAPVKASVSEWALVSGLEPALALVWVQVSVLELEQVLAWESALGLGLASALVSASG